MWARTVQDKHSALLGHAEEADREVERRHRRLAQEAVDRHHGVGHGLECALVGRALRGHGRAGEGGARREGAREAAVKVGQLCGLRGYCRICAVIETFAEMSE